MNTIFVVYIETGLIPTLWRVSRQRPGSGEYLDIPHVLDFIRFEGWVK